MAQELGRSSALIPRVRCPDCGMRSIVRSAIGNGIRSMDHGELWDFSQRCTMCGWSERISDVKLGA